MLKPCAAGALALALGWAIPAAAETQVTTLAGSGVTGFADGAAAGATFMLPLGVAYGGDGTLYVADAAAQRIRSIARDGTVRTLAGGGTPDPSGVWVPGGYADGEGPAARFNHPAAVAVARDGRIYVADSYNHCIRAVSREGRVSTVAGSPARSASSDGPGAAASFVMPIGLAFDRAGNLYVADAGLGGALRKIDGAGAVSTVKLAAPIQPRAGLAVVEDARGPTFVVAHLAGLFVGRPDGSTVVFRNEFFDTQCAAHTAPGYAQCGLAETALRAGRDVGTPVGVAAYDDHTVAYTDFRTNAVRLLDLRSATVRVLAGSLREDGSGRGGGARDGPGRAAAFNMPFGIAIGPGGELAVGDGGSRRVRLIREVDRTAPLLVSELAGRPAAGPNRVVAYAGGASAWQGTEWDDSIQGRLQRKLNQSGCAGCRTAQVVPVVLDSLSGGLAALGALPARRFDALVLHLSAADADTLAGGTPARRQAELSAALRRLDGALKRRGARLLVVLVPLPDDVGPAVGLWGRADGTSFAAGGATAELRAAVGAAGVPFADASAELGAAENASVPAPLFASAGPELAAGGRDALAAAAERGLLSLRAW